jgi:hypothetical protein
MIVVRKQGKRNKIAGIDIKYREKIAFCPFVSLYIVHSCLFYRIKNTNRFCFYLLFRFFKNSNLRDVL